MWDVPPGFYVPFPLAVLYVLLLLRLGAFRRDRQNPNAIWGPPEDIRTFLARDTYDDRGQGLLTVVRMVLILALTALGWMFYQFIQMAGR
jgi:Tfp pilus assembly protein PilX